MIRKSILVALCLGLMTGCAGGMLYKPFMAGSYKHTDLNADHGDKDMKLVVSGNPYLVPDDALFTAIATAMDGKNEGLPIHFTANPILAPEAPGRIEILFSPAVNAVGRQLCTGEAEPAETGDKFTAIMAYCTRDAEKVSVWIDVPRNSQPGDAAFQDIFAQAIFYITPRHPLFDKPESCTPNC